MEQVEYYTGKCYEWPEGFYISIDEHGQWGSWMLVVENNVVKCLSLLTLKTEILHPDWKITLRKYKKINNYEQS